MNLPVVRPMKGSDLQTLIQFAEESGSGITSLPRNIHILQQKLENTKRALEGERLEKGSENYLFCLEWEGKIVGISGIISRIGVTDPFFAYHLLYEVHNAPHLGIKKEFPVLHFTRATRKPTEIGSLFLSKKFRQKHFGKLLSFCRFLFIANFRDRFSSLVIAELRGVNREGYSPFWENVGRIFFGMDFLEADTLRAEYPMCIEELMPKHPLYVDLLPSEAQNVIGVTHEETAPAKRMLEWQGFKMSQYIDLFDAGPHVYAYTDEIKTIKESLVVNIKSLVPKIEEGKDAMIGNTTLDYRATYAPLHLENGEAILTKETAEALNVKIGDPIRYFISKDKQGA